MAATKTKGPGPGVAQQPAREPRRGAAEASTGLDRGISLPSARTGQAFLLGQLNIHRIPKASVSMPNFAEKKVSLNGKAT